MIPLHILRRLACAAAALAFALLFAAVPRNGEAARTSPSEPIQARQLEFLVLEIRGCGVCEIVREQIHPAYQESGRSRDVPMRFVDITTLDELAFGLSSKVQTLPTIVLMQDGREIDRISGLVPLELYPELLAGMINAAR